jgi:hypothetical protein
MKLNLFLFLIVLCFYQNCKKKISNSTNKLKNNFYKFATNSNKNPIEFIIVLYVKKAFKKLTSNKRTIVYIQPITKNTLKNKTHCVIKKHKKSESRNIKKVKNITK